MKKWKVNTIIFILILIVLGGVVTFITASNQELTEEKFIEKLLKENEDNPKSESYLVIDGGISRVNPQTKVKEFKENFSKKEVVKIYADETCQREISTGYITSGMYAKYVNNDRGFYISVYGDIASTDKDANNVQGDGIFNQIELTRQIRHYVKTEGWEIKEENEKKSADLNFNQMIDDEDIKSAIKYIVYDNLDIKKVKEVESPNVEIVYGKTGNDGKYVGTVKVKIKQTNKPEETKKTIYKITGTKEESYKELQGEEQEIELKGEGIYKITAYTYGKEGNKSKGTYELIKIGNGIKGYKIEHYKETLEDGKYELYETENLTGIIDDKITAKPKEYKGFTIDEQNEQCKITGTIEVENELVLKLYYKRNSYKLTLGKNENIESVIGEGEYKYEQEIKIDATLKQEVQEGHKYEWQRWKSDNIDLLQDIEEKMATIKMPAGNITLTANAINKLESYNYEVNYYFDNIKNEELSYKSVAEYGTNIKPEIKEVEEYEVENKDQLEMTIGVNKNILNIYYKIKNYKITYNLDGGKIEETTKNPEQYNNKTKTFTLINPTKEGYTFIGWTGSNGETPQDIVTINVGSTGEKEYTANWNPLENTKYTVNHYTENLDGTYKKQAEEELGGITNSEVSAKQKAYPGFTFNEEKSTKTGIIKADGTLVLEMYYTRNTYKLTLVAGENISEVGIKNNEENRNSENVIENGNNTETRENLQNTEETKIAGTNIEKTFKYQEEVKIFATCKQEEGHTINWDKWTSSDEEIYANQTAKETTITMPLGDITLTANAVKTINKYKYTVEYYYDGIKNNEKTEKQTAEYNTKITSYINKQDAGYKLEKVEGLNLKIGTDEEKNIIKVYYIPEIYNITYRNIANTVITKENPETYTVKTEDILLTNPEKPGYTFLGWTGSNGDEKELEVKIPKGSTGDKEYTAHFKANDGIKYKIEHYIEKLEGGYNLYREENDLEGIMDDEVVATPITIKGFTYNEQESAKTTSGIIKADGSLVLKVYYSRNSYNLKLKTSENILNVEAKGQISQQEINVSYKYEERANILATLKTENGYTISFDKWESESLDEISNQINQTCEIIMPAANITLTAKATKVINQYKYSVNYYYDNELKDTKEETVDFGTVIESYEEKNKDGYEFDKVENLQLKVTSNPSNNIINVYYKLIDYTITYNLNAGNLEEGKENPQNYNIKTQDITLNNPTKPGYIFTGWTGGTDKENPGTTGNIETPTKEVTIQTGSMGNREYTANWTPRTDITYKVEHYTQNLDGENYTLYNIQGENGELTGTMDTIITANPIQITGFTYDAEKSKETIKGTIKADGSLVLKVYYSRNTYKVKLVAGENVKNVTINNIEQSETQIEKQYKYEETININASLKQIEGYIVTWSNWTSDNTELIPNENIQNVNSNIKVPAGNVVLTANANKQKDTFEYKIKYYYDGIEDTEKTVTNRAEFESQITEYNNQNKDGYEFDKTENLPLQITANSESNIIKIHYKLVNYNIQYNLDGGSLEEEKENPTSYNLKTEDITLNSPSKPGYKFLGWTGGTDKEDSGTTGNIETPTKEVTIQTASMGDRIYTANWEEIVYKVVVHHYLVNTTQKLAEDEILTSKVLGEAYTTDNLIPTYNESGEIVETDGREYLDGKEYYEISNSGNVLGIFGEQTIEVTYYYEHYPVVKIVSSPEASLNNTEYITVTDAVDALTEVGLNADSEQSKLQLLRNVKNESVIIKNQNIELDLAACEISSNSEIVNTADIQPKALDIINLTNEIKNTSSVTKNIEEENELKGIDATLKLDNTKLTILDNSTTLTGKVVSKSGIGVYVKVNSEFTLGVEEKPILQTPEIIGKTIGVEKEKVGESQGKFNFFDGKITAKIAINGKVDLTPIVYSTSVEQNSETSQVATLGVVNDVEARIGRKLYTKLEDAVQDAGTKIGTDGSQVEIVLLKNLSKESTVVIDETKNIKLNLDGYTFTTTSTGYVIENYGQLEIGGEESGGIIYSTTNSTILNGSGNDIDGTKETFDLSTIKNETSFGDYYFEYKDGILVPNNSAKKDTNSYGYMELDLTEKVGKYKLNINLEHLSSYYDATYQVVAWIYNSSLYNKPTTDTNYGETILNIRKKTNSTYSIEIVGGRKYILNLKATCYRNLDEPLKIKEVSITKVQEGKLKLSGDTISIQKSGTSESYKSAITNKGQLNIVGGRITGSGSYVCAIENQRCGNVIIDSGNINGNIRGIITKDNCLTTINGGNINVSDNGIYANGKLSEININNCLIKSCIYNNNSYSTINIKGGEIITNTGYAVNNFYGKLIVDGGNITGYAAIGGRGSLIVNGGIINSTTGSAIENFDVIINGGYIYSASDCIYNNYYETNLKINGGVLSNLESNNRPAIHYTRGTINITGGTINSKGTAITTNSSGDYYDSINITGGNITAGGNGIYLPSAKANIIIGTKDGNVIDTPKIKSSLSNATILVKQSTLKFYDGELYGGQNNVISAPLQEIEDEKELITKMQEDGYEKVTLGNPTEYVAEIEGVGSYVTLQDAVNACSKVYSEEATTIKLLKDVNLGRQVKVLESQNIVLDMNEKNIYAYANPAILNEGKLEFINTIANTEELVEKEYTRLTNNGTYYFINQEGKWISNNKGVANSVANSYIEIDLTSYTGNSILTVNAEISSEGKENRYDVGYATISDSKTAPKYDNSSNRFILMDGEVAAKDYTTTLQGGKKYYLHLGYRKDGGTNSGSDCFTINSIKVQGKDLGKIRSLCATILENKGTAKIGENVNYNLYGRGTSGNYQSVIKNIGTLDICGGSIYSSGNGIENIKNSENGTLNISGGVISIYGNLIQGIYNLDTATTNITGGTINTKNTGDSTYAIYNTGAAVLNIESGIMNLNNTVSTRTYGIYNKSTELVNVHNYKITAKNSYITSIYNYSTGGISMNITKTNINNDDEQQLDSYAYLSNSYGIDNDYRGQITVTDSVIDGFYYGIEGSVDVYNTQITNTRNGMNYASGKVENSLIKGEDIGIFVNGGNVQVQDATIESNNYGIKTSGGTATIKGNTSIISKNRGIYISSGSVNLGLQDNVVDKEKPYIKGTNYGIYNNSSTLNFYDGKIEGATGKSIYGSVTNKEDGYQVTKTNNESTSTEITVLEELPVFEIGGVGQYSSLRDLEQTINNLDINNEYTIKILQDLIIGASEQSITIPEGINAVLDINGKNIISSNNNTIINNGTLNIIDSSTDKIGSISNSGSNTLIENNGNMTIDLIKITIDGYGTSSSPKKTIINNKIMTINNANISDSSTEYAENYIYVLANNGDSILTVNGGNINVQDGTIYNNSTSNLVIENTTVDCYRTVNNNTGNIIINGTTDIYNYYGLCNNNIGNVIVNGGIVKVGYNSYYGIENNGVNSTYGDIEINGGDINKINSNGGNVNINNGTVRYINLNYSSQANIYGGTIRGSIEVNGSYAICNIGQNDKIVNNEQVNIIGQIKATSGSLNIYDGKITTSSSYYGIYGYVNKVEEGYRIVVNKDENGNNIISLEKAINVCSIRDTQYSSLLEAINACDGDNNTITLLEDIFQTEKIQVDEAKNVKIDLNGKQLYSFVISELLVNNGTLEINDTSEEQTGKIAGRTKNYIKNTGNLVISGGYFYYAHDLGEAKIIYNTGLGTVNWKNGRMYLSTENYANTQYGIYTDSTGSINVDNIDFKIKGYWSTRFIWGLFETLLYIFK